MDPSIDILQRYDRTRDPDAFSSLVERHAAMVYSVALRITHNAADAEDITQECFLELTRKAALVKTSVAAWLHKTATHRALDLKRNKSARLRSVKEARVTQVNLDDAAWKEIAPILDEVIAELNEEQRVPLISHYLEGRSQAVIASELNISQPTVSRRLEEGLKELRSKLEARGKVLEAGALMGLCVFVLPTSISTGLRKIALSGLGRRSVKAVRSVAARTSAKAGTSSSVFIVTATCVAALLGWLYLSQTSHPSKRTAVPTAAPAITVQTQSSGTHSYTTHFPRAENPISENGNWVNGSSGLDWGYISTKPGLAVGHAGPAAHADSTALLTGNWGPDQSAQATVYAGEVSNTPQVELRLRSRLSPHEFTGYEISHGVAGGPTFNNLLIVRWNGTPLNFTMLTHLDGPEYNVRSGDVVKATMIGNVITVYKNGVQETRITDNTFNSGNPGFGFNELENGDYGITSFTATDGVVNSTNSLSK